uniref:Uncharacterized protein n=1 Tax=Amphimedon queenslandica TaxID=400682 RepID=A0A1X7TL16_AMPQE
MMLNSYQCCHPLKERRSMLKKTRLRNGLTASRKWQSNVDGTTARCLTQFPLRLEGPGARSFYKPCSD